MTEKVKQEAEQVILQINVAQGLASFLPAGKSSSDCQINCALLYNEETTPKLLSSMIDEIIIIISRMLNVLHGFPNLNNMAILWS